jgi:hypothetical protein
MAGPVSRWMRRLPVPLVALSLVLPAIPSACQTGDPAPSQQPPDAPQPKGKALPPGATPACQVEEAGRAMGAFGAFEAVKGSGFEAEPMQRGEAPCPAPAINWYIRFTNGPQVKPLTPMEKGWLAVRNLVDPFNVITILGDAGIAIGSNAHSAYGPGWPGFTRNVGVSFTQDMTGEFFNTFLIPSIVHQDPHYHRMPHASIARRAGHAILQVVWTQGDNGRPMLNYANLVGSAIDDEIGNLYVPGRQTDLPASAERYGIDLASAPIDNFVSEFLPDVASHIHVQVVVIQRIIDQVAKTSDGP